MIEVTQVPGTEEDVVDVEPTTLPDALPVLPLKETVAFPNTMTPLAVGQERSVQLVNDALSRDRMLVMVASRDSDVEQPGPDDVYSVGVVGVIARMLKMPDGTLRILVQGGQRVRIDDSDRSDPIDVVGTGILDLRILARDHHEHPLPGQDVVDELYRALLADGQRRDHVGKGNGLLQRQDWQHVRELRRFPHRKLLNLFRAVLDDLDHASSGPRSAGAGPLIGTCRASLDGCDSGSSTRNMPSS